MISRRFTILTKFLILLGLIMVPIIGLYAYSHQVSVRVVEDGMRSASLNNLNKHLSRFDDSIHSLALFVFSFMNDPNVREFKDLYSYRDILDINKIRNSVVEKIVLQNNGPTLKHNLMVYSANANETLAESGVSREYDFAYYNSGFVRQWTYRSIAERGDREYFGFIRHFTDPNLPDRPLQNSGLIIQISFAKEELVRTLDQMKRGNSGDPFFYHPNYDPIVNQSANTDLIDQVIRELAASPMERQNTLTVKLEQAEYLITYEASRELGWYLIDYMPLERMLQPIHTSRNLFYVTLSLLLLMSVAAIYLLYRHVQVPIKDLTRSLQRIKRGDYSARMAQTNSAEFEYVNTRFNEMAAQIESLIENVWTEKLRSRDAMLKQLQSQINPHFLYNCLYFLKNMSASGNNEAATEMALHLGDYFRYMTRTDDQMTTLGEELGLITHYLTIQQLRMDKISFQFDVDEELKSLEIPRLLLQPIVENSVIHGLEPIEEQGIIHIIARRTKNGGGWIRIENNGQGLGAEELSRLLAEIRQRTDPDIGCGVRNVIQRFMLHFGDRAEWELESPETGGFRTTLRWYGDAEKGEESNVSASHR